MLVGMILHPFKFGVSIEKWPMLIRKFELCAVAIRGIQRFITYTICVQLS